MEAVKSTITERALRPGVVTALVGGTLAAWVLVVARMRGMDAGPGTDLGSAGWDLGIWVTMMAAMMLPSPAPMVLLFRVAQALAVVLVALGVWVAVAPGSVPGLTRPGSEMKMDEMLPTSSRLLA